MSIGHTIKIFNPSPKRAGILETTELCRSYYCSHFTEEETGSEVTHWLTLLSTPGDASSYTVTDYHYCPCNWPPSEKAP